MTNAADILTRFARLVLLLFLLGLAATVNGDQKEQAVQCRPVTHYKVKGCEPESDGSCNKEYKKTCVCPPNPMMKAPCYLICVPEKTS